VPSPKKPPEEVQVEDANVAFEALIKLDSEEKAVDSMVEENSNCSCKNIDNGNDDSKSWIDREEDYFNDSDMEGDKLTLHTNGIVLQKKCAITIQFINDDADNIDSRDGKELVRVKMKAGSPDGWEPHCHLLNLGKDNIS
jgi:hypothetical protein